MMSAMAVKPTESKLEKALEENNQALFELLDCLGATGRQRITLFIERTGEDAKGNTGRV